MKINGHNKNTESLSEVLVHIIGPNNLQNELLARHLEQETTLLCSWGKQLPFMPVQHEDDAAINYLILWDCQNCGKDDIYSEFRPGGKLHLLQCFVALINLHPALAIEQ